MEISAKQYKQLEYESAVTKQNQRRKGNSIQEIKEHFPIEFLMKAIPTMYAPYLGFEDLLQIQVVDYVKTHYKDVNIFSVKNESNAKAKSSIALWKFKKMGLLSGVSDIFICEPRGEYHGLVIELKNPKKYKVQQSQKDFLNTMDKRGYYTLLSNNFEMVANTIEYYLNLEKNG